MKSFVTDRPVAILMVFTAAVVFGFFSYKRLPVTLMPELNYPTITVRTEFPGAAPQEVENEVSRPVEDALGVVGGLSKISSVSRAGISDVVLEFNWGTDMSDATQDVLEKLDLVFLPQEAESPLILHFDPQLDPIMELSFSGQGDRYSGEEGLRRLRRIAELQIKRALEPVKGVAAVRVRGGLEEEIHVLVDESELKRIGISIQTVIDRIQQENINVAGGTVKEGRSEYMVRTLNEYASLEEIANTVVKRDQSAEIRIKDIGRVDYGHKELQIKTKTDGDESVQIDIYKEAEANMVAVSKRVGDILGGLKEKESESETGKSFFARFQKSPFGQKKGLAQELFDQEGARLKIVADRSIFIENSIREVRNTAMIGGLLAVLILYLFLRDARATAIVAVSIPMSLVVTFAPLNLAGVSLNIMSLGGLALGIGMLVDSSIVVLESVFRCREEGDGLKAAAIRGTREVRGAVAASTLTSIAVFFPMVFVEGIAGQAFGDLGLAVVISLSASLLAALFFIPMLASREKVKWNASSRKALNWRRYASWEAFLDAKRRHGKGIHLLAWIYFVPRFALSFLLETAGKLILSLIALAAKFTSRVLAPALRGAGGAVLGYPARATGSLMNRCRNGYPRVIDWSLDNPAPILGLVALSGFIIWQVGRSLDSELLPEVHQGEFTFEVSLPVGTPLEETERILSGVEEAILENKESMKTLLVTFGFDVSNIKRSDEGEHSARFKVILDSNRDQLETETRVLKRLRPLFESVPDAQFRVVHPVLFSSKTPIVVEIHGEDLRRLFDYSKRAEALLADLPELADVESTLKAGAPEIQIVYDRDQITRYGMNVNQVASVVKNMVQGFEASLYNLQDRRIPIMVRLEDADREQVEDVGRLTLNAGAAESIRLSSLAKLDLGRGPSEIRRIDGQRVALIQANLGNASLGGAVERIQSVLREEMDWPGDMTFLVTGQNEEWQRSKSSLYLALGLSLFLVYVIMASQFESLLQPFIILFTVPLAFFGTMIGLKLLGVSLSIVVFLGMILLVGIVVNNAIVLVDYTNLLRGRGFELREAIRSAGEARLRPILITTATTVLGLAPMALGMGDGSEVRRPMAIAVIFGLSTSTLLTLVIIPTIYCLVAEWKEKWFVAESAAAPEESQATTS